MSLQRCKQETTSTDFVKWRLFLKRLWNIPSRTDHYLAQIACEVVRGRAKYPKRVKMGAFILKFKDVKPEADWSNLSPEERLARSKGAWLQSMGVRPEEEK